ncbi:MAG: sigma-70 family RNA polymerase sigma factor [Eubacteriales bacterium]|nr:sigma-70 family RNA polymerase sigma factor [Eubacteriales bacterium]
MEDTAIIHLFWSRNEDAIQETERAYGRKLFALANRIVQSHEDAQECVNDTYWKAWETIPPQRPEHFYAYLAKICRNFALGKLDWKNAARRKAEICSLTQEMEACIPDRRQADRMETQELQALLNRFLGEISQENRLIFLRRYWYMDTIGDIAARSGMTESMVKSRLHRTRCKLESYLTREGIAL